MRKKLSRLPIMTLGFTAMLMQACAPVYVPNVINSPLFGDKMEFTGGGSFGTSGFDLQAAFTPVKHLGITGAVSFIDKQSNPSFSQKHFFGEGGLGYYAAVGQKARFEVYGGYGRGQASANYHNDGSLGIDRENGGRLQRLYLQPGFGIFTDIVSFSIAMRGSYVNFMSFYGGDPTRRLSSFFVEPAFTAKIGYKWIRVFAQIGLSLPTTKEIRFEYDPVLLSLGVYVYFRKYKKAEAEEP